MIRYFNSPHELYYMTNDYGQKFVDRLYKNISMTMFIEMSKTMKYNPTRNTIERMESIL